MDSRPPNQPLERTRKPAPLKDNARRALIPSTHTSRDAHRKRTMRETVDPPVSGGRSGGSLSKLEHVFRDHHGASSTRGAGRYRQGPQESAESASSTQAALIPGFRIRDPDTSIAAGHQGIGCSRLKRCVGSSDSGTGSPDAKSLNNGGSPWTIANIFSPTDSC